MTGHTPGKWKYSGSYEERKHVGFGWFVDLPGKYPRVVRVEGDSEEVADANARLIAAAPRMYKVIKRRAKEGDEECLSIMEAIDKAEGK